MMAISLVDLLSVCMARKYTVHVCIIICLVQGVLGNYETTAWSQTKTCCDADYLG